MVTAIISLLGTVFVGCFAWLFQRAVSNEGRISAVETKQEDLPALLTIQFNAVNSRLDRIERALNGHLKSSN